MVTSISKSSEFHQLPYGLSWFLSSSSRVFHVLPFLVWNLTGHLRSFEFDLRLVATYLPKKIQPWSSVGWKMIDKISRHLWKNMTWRMVNEKHGERSISKKFLSEAPQDTTIKHGFAWDCCLCSIPRYIYIGETLRTTMKMPLFPLSFSRTVPIDITSSGASGPKQISRPSRESLEAWRDIQKPPQKTGSTWIYPPPSNSHHQKYLHLQNPYKL